MRPKHSETEVKSRPRPESVRPSSRPRPRPKTTRLRPRPRPVQSSQLHVKVTQINMFHFFITHEVLTGNGF